MAERGPAPHPPSWFAAHREALLVTAILTLTAAAHAINMFGCPLFEHDEGYRMARAWSILSERQIDPYVYTYDHVPLAYVQLALWGWLTGGLHTFGTAIDSGRVFMLLLQLLSTACVYRIARDVTGSAAVGGQAALLFALSPFAVYLHRIVYEDNISTYWMLVSLLLLVSGRLSFRRVALSGIALGLSILSKEPTAVLIPAFAGLVLARFDGPHRTVAVLGWTAIVGAVTSLFVLYAALRGELFPAAAPAGGYPPPSLIGGIMWQMRRSRDGGLLDPGSLFWRFVRTWSRDEPLLVIGGTFGAVLCILLIRRHRVPGIIGLSAFSLWTFLGRGGMVERYYLIPLIPLLALNLALACNSATSLALRHSDKIQTAREWLRARNARTGLTLISWLSLLALGHHGPGRAVALLCRALGAALRDVPKTGPDLWWWLARRDPRLLVATVSLLGLLALGYTRSNPSVPNFNLSRDPLLLWHSQQTAAQRASLNWVASHIPTQSTVVVENYLWTDLHDGAFGGRVWPRALPHIRAEHNPMIRERILHNDWKHIDYLVGGRAVMRFGFLDPHPRQLHTIAVDTILVREALRHSATVAAFDSRTYPVWVFQVENEP